MAVLLYFLNVEMSEIINHSPPATLISSTVRALPSTTAVTRLDLFNNFVALLRRIFLFLILDDHFIRFLGLMYRAELLLLLNFLRWHIFNSTSALHVLRLDCLLSLMGEHILNPCFVFDLLLGLETRYIDILKADEILYV